MASDEITSDNSSSYHETFSVEEGLDWTRTHTGRTDLFQRTEEATAGRDTYDLNETSQGETRWESGYSGGHEHTYRETLYWEDWEQVERANGWATHTSGSGGRLSEGRLSGGEAVHHEWEHTYFSTGSGSGSGGGGSWTDSGGFHGEAEFDPWDDTTEWGSHDTTHTPPGGGSTSGSGSGSTMDQKREILEAVSLNRTLGDVTLVVEKRKPFDVLAEGLLVSSSRGDKTPLELFIAGVRDWEAVIRRQLADSKPNRQ